MRCKNANHSCNSCGEKKCGNKHTTCHNADVVEVVRCKDCKHRYVPSRCALWYGTVDGNDYFVERGNEFYCSYGERSENEQR